MIRGVVGWQIVPDHDAMAVPLPGTWLVRPQWDFLDVAANLVKTAKHIHRSRLISCSRLTSKGSGLTPATGDCRFADHRVRWQTARSILRRDGDGSGNLSSR